MKEPKQIQKKIDEMQRGVDELEKLLIKTEDAKTREAYMRARSDVKEIIRTLEWVLS